MTFGRFHQSEGLAAISRAMRDPKKVDGSEDGNVGDKTPSGKRVDSRGGDTVQSEAGRAPKEKGEKKKLHKEKKHSKRDRESNEENILSDAEPSASDNSEKRKVRGKRNKKRKHSDPDWQTAESPTTLPPAAEADGAVHMGKSGDDATGDVPKKNKRKEKISSKKAKAKPADDSGDDGEEEEEEEVQEVAQENAPENKSKHPICKLFKRMEKLKTKLAVALPQVQDMEGEAKEQILERISLSGAKVAKLMVDSLNRSKELNEKARGRGEQAGPSKPYFSSIEEAMYTDSTLAGRPEAQAGIMWSAVSQAGVDAIASAKLALRKAAPPPETTQLSDTVPQAPSRKSFEDAYRATFVDAFADDLEKIRTASDDKPVDVNLILRCIKASSEVFDEMEKELFLQGANSKR